MPITFKDFQSIDFSEIQKQQLEELVGSISALSSNCGSNNNTGAFSDRLSGITMNMFSIMPGANAEEEFNNAIITVSGIKDLFTAQNFKTMLENDVFSKPQQIDINNFLAGLELFSSTYNLGINIAALNNAFDDHLNKISGNNEINNQPNNNIINENEFINAPQQELNNAGNNNIINNLQHDRFDNSIAQSESDSYIEEANNINNNADISNEIFIDEADPRAEALNNKRSSTKGKLDSFSGQLNKKHRIPFIGGGTSDELQTVKNAIELYKNFCDDPTDPRYAGMTETSLLNGIKKAAEDYIDKKKENRWKDTTREDWTPNTRMGTERFLGVKGVLKTAVDRIKEIEDDEREYAYSLQRNDRIREQQKKEQKKLNQLVGTIEDLIEDSLYDTDYSKLSDDKLRSEFASFTAWMKLSKQYGNEAIVNDHKAEHDTLCEKYKNDKYFNGFFNKWKSGIKNRKFLSADSSVCEELEKYTILSKQTEEFIKKFGEGSVGAFIANTRFNVLTDDSKYKDETLKDLIAAEMICSEKGFDTALDKNELDNTKETINEAAFDRFIESLSRAQKIGLVNAPDDLLNEYSRTLSVIENEKAEKMQAENVQIKNENIININAIDDNENNNEINNIEQAPDPENIDDDDIDYQEDAEPDIYSEVEYDPDDPIPGSLIPYQNNIRRAIKGDKSFEETKAAVKESIAGILSTKALWSKPEKQPISVITTNMNNDEDVEKYLSENSKKCEMRDSGIKQLMTKNKEFDFMFSGINNMEQLKELSEKALHNDASELMIEQKKAADKLASINGNISKTEQKDTVITSNLNK